MLPKASQDMIEEISFVLNPRNAFIKRLSGFAKRISEECRKPTNEKKQIREDKKDRTSLDD